MANEFIPHDDTLDPDEREIAALRDAGAKKFDTSLTDLWRDAMAEDLEDDEPAPSRDRPLSNAEQSRIMREGYASDLD